MQLFSDLMKHLNNLSKTTAGSALYDIIYSRECDLSNKKA